MLNLGNYGRKEDNNLKKRIICLIFILMLPFCLAGCNSPNAVTSLDPRTKIVREGSFAAYPDIKIEDAYKAFFTEPQWRYFQATDGKKVVEFSGKCTYMDKPVKATWQFILHDDNENFELGALDFNGVPQNRLLEAALLEKVFENYSNSGAANAPSEDSRKSNDASMLGVGLGDNISNVDKILREKLGGNVQGVLGAAKEFRGGEGFGRNTWVRYYDKGFWAIADSASKKIVGLSASTSACKLPNGLSVGASAKNVRQAYGGNMERNAEEGGYTLSAAGDGFKTIFYIDNNDRVWKIEIWAR
jgi:hypothetical protein